MYVLGTESATLYTEIVELFVVSRAYPLVGRNEVGRCAGQHKPNLEQAHPHSEDGMPLVAPTDPDHERKPTVTQIVEETSSYERGEPTSPEGAEALIADPPQHYHLLS